MTAIFGGAYDVPGGGRYIYSSIGFDAIQGDVNGDGAVDEADATQIQGIIALLDGGALDAGVGGDGAVHLHDFASNFTVYDVTNDGVIDADDVNAVLRANGDTRTPSILMAAAGLINAGLDPIFIFGFGPIPAMGIQGAAVATLLSWIAGVIFLFYFLAIRHELIHKGLPTGPVFRTSAREMLRIGVPASGANMMTPIAAGIMTAIIAGYGETAVAAFGVGSRMESIACMVILALSSTLPPFVSQNLGAGKLDRIEQACRQSIRFVLGWQLLVYVVMALGASLIAWVFTRDEEVADIIRLYIWIMPLSYGMQGVIILCNSALNAIHRPMVALYLSIARFFVLYVPLAWLGSQMAGLTGFFMGAFTANVLMAALSWYCFRRVMAVERSQMIAV